MLSLSIMCHAAVICKDAQKRKIEQLNNEVNQKLHEANQFQDQSTKLRDQCKRKRNQLETYEIELRQLEEELAQHRREALEIESTDSQVLTSDIEEKLDKFCNTITEVQNTISACKVELNGTLKDIVKCEGQLRSVLSELNHLKSKLERLEQLEKEKINLIVAAAERVDSLGSSIRSRHDLSGTGLGIAALRAISQQMLGPAGPLLTSLASAGVTMFDAMIGNPNLYNKEQHLICAEYNKLISKCKNTVQVTENVCTSCQQDLEDIKRITTEMKLYTI